MANVSDMGSRERKRKRKCRRNKGIKRIKGNVELRAQKVGFRDRSIRIDENKASLVLFLCTEMSQMYLRHPKKELVVSAGFTDPMKVLSPSDRSLGGLR